EKLNREIVAFDDAHPSPTAEELEQRDDIIARIDQLQAFQNAYEDVGPIFDCVVFNDGNTWRAAIDTDGDGDFSNEKTLTNYRDEHEFSTFGEDNLLNYVLNIYQDGDVLSIVADAGAHGTHVAGMVAANFPDQPELNGMAPGAQIVAVKIGDTRLGSSSVGTGSSRGYTTVIENQCDLINKSYGGASAFHDRRYRNDRLASEIVDKFGVIFVASAGNEGPTLSTVGGPGGTTSSLIGVGAAISPEMMKAQYAVREGQREMIYPWSSRGPTLDGDLGVDICAPGGAISPVPNWTLQKTRLMNGTSMSSPNTCGGIALILSKLKQEGIAYSPHAVKRALINTARQIPDQSPWAQGHGMIQIDAAYEYLVNEVNDLDRDVRFSVTGPNGVRGAYLREPYENNQPVETRIKLEPNFHEDADNRDKVAFEMRLNLEATEPWVEVASFINLVYGGKTTDVRIDPTGLEPGAHFAEVLAYDADRPDAGPILRYPITVVRGIEVGPESGYTWHETIDSGPGDLNKWFFTTPEDATWMDLIIRRKDTDTSRLLLIQMLQLVKDKASPTRKLTEWVRFDDEDEQMYSMAVDGNRTLEIDAAHYWSSIGPGEFEFEVRFRGLRPEPSNVLIDGGSLVTRFDVLSPMRDAIISPSGSLTGLRRSIRPSESTIRALDPVRDRLPDDRQMYENVLTYDLSLADEANLKIDPAINLVPHAWEEYEGFLWYIFGENGELVESQAGEDVDISLNKGDYTLKIQIRHDDPDMLELVNDAPIRLTFQLDSPISLSFTRTPDEAFEGGGRFGNPELETGASMPVYIATPGYDALPDFAEPGDLLVGSFTIGGHSELLGSNSRPGGWPVEMTIPPEPIDKPEPEASDDTQDQADPVDQIREDIRDLKIAGLDQLMDADHAEAFDSLANEILAEWPDSLQVLVKVMERAVHIADDENPNTQAIITASQAVIDAIDTDELAAYVGINHDPDADDFDKELDERMTEEKEALIDALTQIALALGKVADADDPESVQAFDEALDRLEAWTDLEGDDFFELRLMRERLHGRLGKALTLLSERLESNPDKALYELRIELLETIGWEPWAEHEREMMLVRYPPAKPLF
ncbi:MAG TPA: hypothetical protein ENJ00_01025, partial [Phycisphaerales bacterium]|nr:hypothetical protein [Phycisphaerales bacterium]